MKDRKFSVLGLVVLVACSPEPGSDEPANQNAGGASTVGGSMSTGGASGTPGNSSGGATLAAGGSLYGGAASGGYANDSGGVSSSVGGASTAVASGGTIAAGGTVSVGGTVNSGGSLGLGGGPVTGGATKGGASATGGTQATGGAPATTGGKSATGGAATGGASTVGGTSATGGTATGAATGGAATGGTTIGGTATGGTATGGTATGGTATGGTATGGTATGGTATGGTTIGGAATGGTATGGAATGGTTAGGTTCTPPASASAIQFVDPAAGTDDDQHGGAFGACGYKTLTYALTRATGQIALQSATYSAATETFPIVLNGSQQLLCKYTTASSAIIQGKGPDVAGAQATIAFHGTRNALNNCIVDGNGSTGYCVYVTYSGSFSTSPHIITNSDIGYCGTAGVTIRYADNVTISNSSIHNNQIGVSWLGPNAGGSMLTNKFKANSIYDIQCSIADTGVTGSGNTALGSLYCSQCGNCPF